MAISLPHVPTHESILIVDDNKDDLTLFQHYFDRDYEVYTADNGEEALKITDQNPISLILLDINMPGMNGFHVLEHLRSDPRTRFIPVLFLTDSVSKKEQDKALDMGGADFILKNSSDKLVLSRVRSAMLLSKSLIRTDGVSDRWFFSQIEDRLYKKALQQNIDSKQIKELVEELSIIQAELLAQNEELQEQKKINQDLMLSLSDLENDLPVGFARINADNFQILQANQLARQLLVIISNQAGMGNIKTSLLNNYECNFFKIFSWLKDPDKQSMMELKSKVADNWIAMSKNHLDDDTLLIAFMDISDKKKAEMEQIELARRNEELAIEANRNKSSFLASMSHELRTPMHAITNFANLGLKRYQDAQKSEHYFQNIHASATRLNVLLNDLLDLAKLEAGRIETDFVEQDLSTLIEQAISEINSLLLKNSITINLNMQKPLVCTFDQKLLFQVMINLLSNAIKFSPQNSTIDIQVKPLKQKRKVLISIADQGIGIPQQDLKKIFGKFHQSKSNNRDLKAKGTGLGLSICKEIVSLHQGQIWVESPVAGQQQGSVFYIEIPLVHWQESLVSFSNIEDAINSHKELIRAIDEMFAKSQSTVRQMGSIISNENICLFGQWLEHEQLDADKLDLLKKLHTEFHHAAGECVAYYDINDFQNAEEKRLELKILSKKIFRYMEMAELIIWQDSYSVGIELMDQHHRKIIQCINDLIVQNHKQSNSEKNAELLNRLSEYSSEHLAVEEALLKKYDYPEFAEHKQQHESYLESLDTLITEREITTVDSHLLEFLHGWWLNHILDEDMRYKAFFAGKDISL